VRRTALVVAVILAAACKLPPKPKGADAAKSAGKKGSAAAIAPLSVDEPFLREARAAKSSFLESRGDCPVLKRGLPGVLTLFDEAQKKTTTQGGHDAIEAMKQEVRDAVTDCSS
jgi:hypothetical protein